MPHGHEHLDSGNTEHYTPSEVVEAARIAMGGIDLDPASCLEANQVVKAGHYFSKLNNGLDQDWYGRGWLNHPFERGANGLWITKLLVEYISGNIEAACCITWANIDTDWFRPLLDYPQCFPHGRIHYRQPGGKVAKSAPKGSVITYLGDDLDAFAAAFKHIGTVKVAI